MVGLAGWLVRNGMGLYVLTTALRTHLRSRANSRTHTTNVSDNHTRWLCSSPFLLEDHLSLKTTEKHPEFA